MTMALELVLVAIGGSIGATLRFGITRWINDPAWPIGTAIVNLVGSSLLAVIVFADLSEPWLLFVGVGGCGALTTFSSFAFETVELHEGGHTRRAIGYALGTLVTAALGVAIGAAIAGV